MRHEVLMGMPSAQLDQYMRVCGIDIGGGKTREEKVAAIEDRRSRVAEIDIFGATVSVPIRAVHDKRVTDMLNGRKLTDEEATRLMVMLLGDEQYDTVLGLCTDEDGVVDVEAVGIAFSLVVNSEELKNF